VYSIAKFLVPPPDSKEEKNRPKDQPKEEYRSDDQNNILRTLNLAYITPDFDSSPKWVQGEDSIGSNTLPHERIFTFFGSKSGFREAFEGYRTPATSIS
jgi:hypothetical protein